jgi:hypothetical protein
MVSGHSELEASREDNYMEPIPTNKGTMFLVLQVLLCRRYGLHSSQPRRVMPPQAYRLSLSTFWSDYSHWKYEKKADSKTEAIHFRGMDRNHRLLIWRTSKSTPTFMSFASVQILRILLRASMTQQTSLNGSAKRESYSAP